MINVLIYKIDFVQDNDLIDSYIDLIPESIKHNILAFVNMDDKIRTLAGKILLIYALAENHYSIDKLSEIEYNHYKKPFFRFNFYFNISHSGQYTVLSYSLDCKNGIDIEKIDDIDFSDFTDCFNENEWQSIRKAKVPKLEFFNKWTMKESIIKAEGIGLYCPLIDIDTSNDKIKGLNRSWYIKKIFIDDAYSCHVSFGKANETISTINVSKEQIQKIRTSI